MAQGRCCTVTGCGQVEICPAPISSSGVFGPQKLRLFVCVVRRRKHDGRRRRGGLALVSIPAAPAGQRQFRRPLPMCRPEESPFKYAACCPPQCFFSLLLSCNLHNQSHQIKSHQKLHPLFHSPSLPRPANSPVNMPAQEVNQPQVQQMDIPLDDAAQQPVC